MTPEPVQPVAHGTCPLCASATMLTDERCPACGCALAGVDGRPGPFSRTALLWSAAAFLAVYVVTLLIVVATR